MNDQLGSSHDFFQYTTRNQDIKQDLKIEMLQEEMVKFRIQWNPICIKYGEL